MGINYFMGIPTASIAAIAEIPKANIASVSGVPFGGWLIEDNFDSYSAGTLGGQGNWVAVLNLMTVYKPAADGEVHGNNGGESCARYNSSLNDDQKAQITISAVSSSNYIGPAVRCSGTGDYYGYYGEDTQSYLFRSVSSVWSQLGNTGSGFSANDVVELRIEGTQLTAYINGEVDTTVGTDGSAAVYDHSSGDPGVTGYGNATTTRGDDFKADNM